MDDRETSLLAAVGGLATDLELAQVLQRVVSAACWIADARFGALGVIGEDGLLSEFVHEGLDPATVAVIGRLPEGHGVLGQLITDPQPLRLANLGEHASSFGFPAGHPPMRGFLGVPVLVRGEVFGNLYLCEKRSGDEFSEADERRVVALAAAAGSAIANARLHDEVQLRERSLTASQSIATALLSGANPDDVLELVAAYARDILDADTATIALPHAGGDLSIRVAVGHGAADLRNSVVPARASISGEVLRTGRPVAVSDAASVSYAHQPMIQMFGSGPMVFVPLWDQGTPLGTLAVGRRKGRQPFHRTALSLLQSFAMQASVGLEFARAQRHKERLAVYEDEQRIAHDLHDTVIQDLFATGLRLQGATQLVTDSGLREQIDGAVDAIDKTIRNLRTAIFGLTQTAVATGGLRNELLEVVRDLAGAHGLEHRVNFDGILDARVDDHARAQVVAVVREAVSNAGRHAQAKTVDVDLRASANELVLLVVDDGIGIPDELGRRSGVSNMQARAEALGGHARIAARSGGGTEVEWRIPLS
ncbi:MAG TPA: GAF domain-containing protein [Acidimicrobiales bacterium]|nr:GAF domain-containing protein [Acidimicrobiales bacterium]